ncbi:1-acyl-sn-glycerol-3-phosphate acyltransferase [Antrihabitans cavernicola]|uniref:1-acyl-sn-glycerol-3-phosphate acyltransferase n=2 Tax=Antrihabitans cavernicola TaxID=2495913 RepID=A0A5A7SGV5_9NOCA|nr:1-acyl-sn-glycerol-3-phosphate acyltransferase [Spelaeibacter cavernicola]
MPSSPCGTGCIDTDADTVSNTEFAMRLATVVALMATFPVANTVAKRGWRNAVQRRYARALLGCCGVELRIVDNRGTDTPGITFAEPGDGVLVVCGHVGWTDILVLAAVQPVSFVARADLIDWPILGSLARRMRVIPIDRANLRKLPAVVAQIADRISAGERIAAFPEGTTWCGRAYGNLRPALFQAAIDTDTAVQPVRLQYIGADGALSTTPAFVGDETMAQSLLRMLWSTGTTAEVVLAPVEQPGTDRRDLAARCERAVRGHVHLDFAEHGVLEPGQRNTVRQPAEPVPESCIA